MNDLESIEKLSKQLSRTNVYDQLLSRLESLKGEQIRISITGGSNVGKSSLVNVLTGSNLEVTSLPTNITTRVTVETESEWMKKSNLEVWELSEQDLPVDAKRIDFALHFAHTDVCVMLLNSMAALSRSEMKQIENLDNLCIPTLLVLAKTDQMQDNDFAEVVDYVKQKVSKYNYVSLLPMSQKVHVRELAVNVSQTIDGLLADFEVRQIARASLKRVFEDEALEILENECKTKMASFETAKQKVAKMTADKKSKISDSTTLWIRLQSELTQRKRVTASKISEIFEKKKNDTIRQITHNVEMCQDVKTYWEKEMPYRMEDIIRMNSQTAIQLINNDIVNTVNWLNAEVKKSFNKNLNSIQPISCTFEPDTTVTSDNPDIADNRKMRIVARVGTAATVIAAGTMFATMGIGGIVMAASMMAGIGAEFFMNRKQDESKKKVKELIPTVVEQAHQKLAIEISDNLGNAYSQLLKNLQAYQEQWMEEANKSIEEENKIALYNCTVDAAQWEQCMQQIIDLRNNNN